LDLDLKRNQAVEDPAATVVEEAVVEAVEEQLVHQAAQPEVEVAIALMDTAAVCLTDPIMLVRLHTRRI
jgi:hypothetical protein